MAERGGRVALRAGIALAVVLAAFAALVSVDAGAAYLWLKALHVVAVIAWMAGLLYLPRLYVNHAEQRPGSPEAELLKGMEQRLLRIIMTPAMLLAWGLGLWLAWTGFGFSGGWLWAKLALVLGLSAYHGFLVRAARAFAADADHHGPRFWRLMNEVPALLMIAIVILVVVKPF